MPSQSRKKSKIKKIKDYGKKKKRGGSNMITNGSSAEGRWMEVEGGDVIYRIDVIGTITIPKNIIDNSNKEIIKLISKQKLNNKQPNAVYEKLFAALLAVVKFEAKHIPFEKLATTK